ncbi:MAG: phytoene desaturase family protein [Planctomycetota bacterium]
MSSPSAFDAVVIGTGASGLVCARLLAMEGKRVLCVEKHNRLGGYLQRFYREKIPFDTGFHYTGKLGPQGVLRRFFAHLGILDDLRFHELDRDAFDIIRTPDVEVRIPAGRDRYRERLKEHFPREARGIDRYVDELGRVSDLFPMYALRGELDDTRKDEVVASSPTLAAFLDSITDDPALKLVLAGQAFLHGTPPSRAPFWVHALVTDSFISEGAWGIDGGGDALARALSRRIKEAGGEVRLADGATKILVEERTVKGVELESGERVDAPIVIAAIHPRVVVELLPESAVTPAYRSRIEGFEESITSLGLYYRMKSRPRDAGPWNIYWHRSRDLEASFADRTLSPDGPKFLFATWPSIRDSSWRYPENMILLAPAQHDEVARWTGTRTMKRPEDYERWKQRIGEHVGDALSKIMPDFSGDLLAVSTPLTNRDYTGSHLGSNYGVLQSSEQQGLYKLSVRTRVKGLYLTGQSLGLMGLVGVTVTAFRTAGEIVGLEKLYSRIRL